MRGIFLWMLGAGMALGLCHAVAGQDRPHIEGLFAQLEKDETLAREDSDSHDYIAERLPFLIRGSDDKLLLWLSAVQMAGELKDAKTVPILTKLLRRDHRSGPVTLGMDSILYDDPVAKALSLIGDPATDSVAGLFENGDPDTRRRAAIVLTNIGTPDAREAILRQIDKEPDPKLKAFMQSKVQ
jgi:HEAT repeat protein